MYSSSYRVHFASPLPQLEEEVRRLGTLTEEREKHCRYATKALELLPSECTNCCSRFPRTAHLSSLIPWRVPRVTPKHPEAALSPEKLT